MKKLVFAFQLVAIAIISVAVAQKQAPPSSTLSQKPCSRSEERRALDEHEKLKTWGDIFHSFKSYGHCDDGAIAEGYSDKVVHLLAMDWKSFTELNHLTKANPDFRNFILRHIDTTASWDELRSAQQNARRRCPAEGTTLCRVIDHQITHAFEF
jgi:hypothetical protein